MKVCFICAEYPPGPHGGIGTMTQVMARMLAQRGHEVRVAGVYPRHYPAPDRESDRGVEVIRLRETRMKYGWLYSRRRLYRQVADWVKRGEADLIEVPDYQGWAAGWRRLRAPVVARVHGTLAYFAAELGQRADRVASWLESASLRR